MKVLFWIILFLIIVVLLFFIPKMNNFIHKSRLLRKSVPNSFFGLTFGDSFDDFKELFKFEETGHMFQRKGTDSYIVKKVTSSNIFEDIEWDYVIFDFFENKFCSIYFYNEESYRQENLLVQRTSIQDYINMFDSLFEKFDLIDKTNKYMSHRMKSAFGVFRNNIEIELEYASLGSTSYANNGIDSQTNLLLSFVDLSVCPKDLLLN